MKKNRMMRLASGLLVAVLLTTCAISGTFAKYVTSDSASDSARVAKWGVVVTASGSLFGKNYINAAGGNKPADAGELTVVSSSVPQDNVVAPGTKNDTGMSFEIKGTPEVDTKLTVAVTSANDIKLAKKDGGYTDPTTGDPDAAKVVLTDDYYPVVFTLKNGNGDILTVGNIAAIKAYFEGETFNKVYNANTPLETIGKGVGAYETNSTDGEYVLTWAWAYGTAASDIDNKNITDTDRYDTILGNAAVTPIAGATTNIDIKIEILVEQVD